MNIKPRPTADQLEPGTLFYTKPRYSEGQNYTEANEALEVAKRIFSHVAGEWDFSIYSTRSVVCIHMGTGMQLLFGSDWQKRETMWSISLRPQDGLQSRYSSDEDYAKNPATNSDTWNSNNFPSFRASKNRTPESIANAVKNKFQELYAAFIKECEFLRQRWFENQIARWEREILAEAGNGRIRYDSNYREVTAMDWKATNIYSGCADITFMGVPVEVAAALVYGWTHPEDADEQGA